MWKVLVLLLGIGSVGASQAADLTFTSASDFTEMNLELKKPHQDSSDIVMLNVTLSPEAQGRAETISRQAMKQSLTLFINGIQISTTTVHSVLGPRFGIAVPRPIALELIPTLLAPAKPTS